MTTDPSTEWDFVQPDHAAKALDLPPWIVGYRSKPRMARFRWMLRRILPRLVWPDA